MRTPTYLSYSSVSLFEKEPDEFYLKYLSENRPPRLPQTPPMCVGSSFDAYVKADLHASLFGLGSDPEYELDALFTSQVEEPNRDFAWKAGAYCFEKYKLTGSHDELLALLQQSTEPPRFECRLTGTIGGAPFLGKPDCRFVLDLGFGRVSVVFDWKVKGFCSKYSASPTKGYALCRDGYAPIPNKKGVLKASLSHGTSHKMFMEWDYRGLKINRDYMENCSSEYADQCTLYGWLLGEEVGGDTLVFIDELCCKSAGDVLEGEYPFIRVANHRARVKPEYQQALVERVGRCWGAITSGHVFLDDSREESDLRIETLEDMATGLASDGSDEEEFFNVCTRPQYKR
jgi:hypothetical protein